MSVVVDWNGSSTAARALDMLTTDNGWWLPDRLSERLGVKPGTVRRALERMRADGLVESRLVEEGDGVWVRRVVMFRAVDGVLDRIWRN